MIKIVAPVIPPKHWLFIIDTEQCLVGRLSTIGAYLTGVYSDDLLAATAKSFFKDTNRKESISVRFIDTPHGFTYVVPYPTAGWFSNGMENGHFKDSEMDAAISHYKQACIRTANQCPVVEDEDQARWREEWLTKAKTGFEKLPAFLSIALILCECPSAEDKRVLKNRTLAFVAENQVTITAFRTLQT